MLINFIVLCKDYIAFAASDILTAFCGQMPFSGIYPEKTDLYKDEIFFFLIYKKMRLFDILIQV
jgi:hypothetical protein